MEERKNGRMEEWKNGRGEEWKRGRMEEGKNGRGEEWKNGRGEEWKRGRMEEGKNGRGEEWKRGRMEEWKRGRMEEGKNGRGEEWKNGRGEEWKNGRGEEWKNGRGEEWKRGRMEEGKNGRGEEWKRGRMEEWKNGRGEEWKNGRMEEGKNGRMEEGKNGRGEEWKNGRGGRGEEWKNGRLKLLQNRIFSSQYILLFLLVGLFYYLPTIGNAANVTMTSDADRFLRHLIGAEHRGMGGSFVGAIGGANAIGTNPAGIGIVDDDNRFVIHMARFPRTVAMVAKPNINTDYEDYSQYEQRASGIETLNWVFPFGKFGTLGVTVSMGHEGPFRRVSHEGKALNNFPENNLATGMGYGIEFFGGTLIGFDANWIRSKITDESGIEHFGHGYTYNVGLIQKIGQTLQVGVVLRNLSNGLSFADSTIPNENQPRCYIWGCL